MTLLGMSKDKIIHMVGIGGTSMSGIAEIVLNLGYKVTGSDSVESRATEKLEKAGIKIYYGHFPENVEGADLVVYTAAIKKDNPELIRARELGIRTMERADFLGEITRYYEETVAICGTHGKTTTTSMISLAFLNGGKDPSIQVGSELRQIDGNYRVGNSPYFVIEACEYVESFLKFFPETVTLLNIEEDHLDYYKDLNHIKSAFTKFVNLVPERGFVIINCDDTDCLDVVKDIKSHLITFGIVNDKADWKAIDIKLNDTGFYSFTAVNEEKKEKIEINLKVPGYHNVYNALATVATASAHNIGSDKIKEALEDFTGAARRFEYVGKINNASIYDDYAHHPTEIMATIKAASNIKHNKLWVVFQPHTYSRTKALFNDFSNAFKDVDELIITDIYAAREKDDGETSSQRLAIAINEISNNCTYISKFEKIVDYLKENVKENDIVLTLGAGTVTKIGYMLIKT